MAEKNRPNAQNKTNGQKGYRINGSYLFTAALASVLFILLSALSCLNGAKPVKAILLGVLVLVIYACALVLFNITVAFLKKKNLDKDSTEKIRLRQSEDLPLGAFARLDQPCAICNEDAKIVWMNRSFANRMPRQMLIKGDVEFKTLFDYSNGEYVGKEQISISPSGLSETGLFGKLADTENGVTVTGIHGFGGEWTMHSYTYSSDDNDFFILVFTEDTERNSWIRKYNDNLTHIAYIVIDNLEELAQSEQESYRVASTQVDAQIKAWAAEHKAFIKEYEREKYVMAFHHDELASLDKKRFDILERVSKIRIGSENLSATVSLGVSSEIGTLDEKDKIAQSALEMALQRGGNQAVVMMGSSPKFYGAKSLTSLKRSGVRHRVFADKLIYRLGKCSNVIIMGHRNPDFDAFGSSVGLARLAMSLGKPTNIIANTADQNLQDCFAKLLPLPEYASMFIDATEAQEKLTADTLVICSDVNNPDNFEAVNVAANADYLFIIDHHRQSEKTPEAVPEHKEILIVPSASSASELVSEILELGLPGNARLHREEADIMFAGILLDTKNFTRNAQVPTFGAAIYLRDNGADPIKAQALFKTELDEFRQESAFSTDLEIYRECVVIAKENGDEIAPMKRITAAKTADRLLNIKKIRASFVVAKMQSDVFISARSDGSVNVQLIMESLRGGGHYNAAATMLKETDVDEAVEKLKASISAYFGTETEAPMPKKKRKRNVKKK